MKTLKGAKQLIVGSVLNNILTDINNNDLTVITALLMNLSTDALITSMPESEWAKNFKIAEIDKTKIEQFIKEYGTRVRANEDYSYVQLMMDDHICIQWGKKLYYIPENCTYYSSDDQLIWDVLNEYYTL